VPISKYLFTFTDDELIASRNCLDGRNEFNDKYKVRTDRTVCPTDPNKDWQSILSELAVAKFLGVEYNYATEPDAKRFDVGNCVEVRSSLHERGHLIVYEYDNKPGAYVFTTVDLNEPSVTICGWRDLIDCRLDKYWRTTPKVRKESWWIPQSDLHDMKSLRERLVLA